MIWVMLSTRDVAWATGVGVERNAEAEAAGLEHSAGFVGDGQKIHVLGALGELACARALYRPWEGSVNSFKRGGDVGRLQVRTTQKATHSLIVRDEDRPEDAFVLVNGEEAPAWFEVVGWIRGEEARQRHYRRTAGGRPPAWFVPRDHLCGISPPALKRIR